MLLSHTPVILQLFARSLLNPKTIFLFTIVAKSPLYEYTILLMYRNTNIIPNVLTDVHLFDHLLIR